MWYLRKNGEVKGPYPAGLISRYILLGRINDGDEVSGDGEEWLVIRDIPELIPDVMKGDASDPLVQERLQAARRWADERGAVSVNSTPRCSKTDEEATGGRRSNRP